MVIGKKSASNEELTRLAPARGKQCRLLCNVMLEVGRMDLFEDGAAQLMFKLEFSISLSTLEGYQSRPGCPSGRTARVDEVLIAKIRSDVNFTPRCGQRHCYPCKFQSNRPIQPEGADFPRHADTADRF